MIEGKNICKSFDGSPVLDNTSFHIEKGSVYGLIGPNGSGKSTLLRHITGIFAPDSGEILIDGQNVFENTFVKSKFAFIPDEIFYYRQSTIDDMKNFYKGIYSTFNENIYEKLLAAFDSINRKKFIRNMSKGMQKQAAFILAIAIQPEILILDEPVDGLDPVIRRQIWSILLSEVEKKEMTVLVSSHNLRELEDVCDHIGILHNGKIIHEKSLEDFQGNITKLQMAFKDDAIDLDQTFEILQSSNTGRIITLIIKGNVAEVKEKALSLDPLFVEVLPVTLEEAFIYELGGENYEVKNILL